MLSQYKTWIQQCRLISPQIGCGLVKEVQKIGLELDFKLGKMGVTASSQLIGENYSGAIKVFHTGN